MRAPARKSILRRLQNRPHALELIYSVSRILLLPFRRWLARGRLAAKVLASIERFLKAPIFDCRMCGQCTLHATGMTCPMTCPKNLRNGPCGGVRPDGNCEILPHTPCVWVEAWRRSRRMPCYGHEIIAIQPALDWRLQGGSAWVNEFVLGSRRQ